MQNNNIKDRLSQDKYLIPLYQRNFAWGETEIIQLLEDMKNASTNCLKHYYLGTLVVSKKENEEFYVITDGQQRFTILSIINAVIKNYTKSQNCINDCNLHFEAREKTRTVLEQLHKDSNSYIEIKEIETEDAGIANIVEAVNIVETFFHENIKQENYKSFIDFFYEKVMLFRTNLPKHTDLNHYFEIMNNRGEQLEKHEILKAAFISKINCPEKEKAFAKIWDACSIMNSHLQMNFDSSERTVLFGEDWQYIPDSNSIENYSKLFYNENTTENNYINKTGQQTNKQTLNDIIDNFELSSGYSQAEDNVYRDRFVSIIDFSNFLLQVLSVSMDKIKFNIKVRLDDNFLLNDFGYPNNNLPDPMIFIVELLRLRVLFDRYIIKREEDEKDWSWSLRKCVNNANYYEVSIHDERIRHITRVLQSMLHVTFTTNNYKNWLQHFLKTLDKQDNSEEILINSLKEYIKDYYNDNFKEENKIFFQGTHTPRFLFNLLDFILWEEYYEKVRGDKKIAQEDKDTYINKINSQKSNFDTFRFVQRSSVEHLFPQGRINELTGDNDEEKKKTLHSFGNLCLVSRSSNSFFGKNMPIQKKNDGKNKNESLKQLIMFTSFNENATDINKWNKNEIEAHHKEMTDLLESYINGLKNNSNE